MQKILFNRMECAGSLGDLGTLLHIAMGMILINGLNPLGLFFAIGLFYIISGFLCLSTEADGSGAGRAAGCWASICRT